MYSPAIFLSQKAPLCMLNICCVLSHAWYDPGLPGDSAKETQAQYFCLILKSASATKNHVPLRVHIRKDCCAGEAGKTVRVSMVSSVEGYRRGFPMKALEYTVFDVSLLASIQMNSIEVLFSKPFVCIVK